MAAPTTTPTPTDAAAAPVPRRGAFAYFDLPEEAKARSLFQILREDGSADEVGAYAIDEALCRRMHERMLSIRVMDARLMALQRQGRTGFYGEAVGQEAAIVGSALVSQPQDWIVPALREAGVGLTRGMSLDDYVAQIFGNALDPTKGRQMPCHPIDRARNYVVMSSCIATQIPHAVGVAMAMKLKGDRGAVAWGYMGDGATSEGDFHTAMNFAGVFAVPAVLICQNNQWAISTPGTIQTAAETIAQKGLGYGLESLRADGNDVFAVYEICKYAADKARRGGGPTFIELLTYRVSAHSSSDDPSRYRDEGVTDVWKSRRDPLRRLRIYMEHRGWLADGEHDALAARLEAGVREVIARVEAAGPPPRESLIEDVFEEPTWILREQLAALDDSRH